MTQLRSESLDVPFVPQIPIERDSATPLYQQISQPLSELISSGQLVPGQLIEDEVAMANRLQVSRPTARRALEELVNRGLVIRRRRVGTRVAPRHVHRPLGLTSLYDDLQKSGYDIRTEVLSYEIVLADAEQAAQLKTAEDTETVRIRRLRYIDDSPLAIMANLIPTDVAPSFRELNEQGLYACLRCRGINPYSAEQSIGARLAVPGSPPETTLIYSRSIPVRRWSQCNARPTIAAVGSSNSAIMSTCLRCTRIIYNFLSESAFCLSLRRSS